MHVERILSLLAEASFSAPAMLVSGSVLVILIGLYGWLAHRSSARAVLTARPFGIPDAVWALVLGALLIRNVIVSPWSGAHHTITMSVIMMSMIQNALIVLFTCLIIGLQGQQITRVFGLEISRLPKAAGTGLLWLVVITYPLIFAAQWFTQAVFGKSDGAQEIVRYFLEHPEPRHRIAIMLMAVIVAPVSEEILFRGYLYGVIRRFGGRIPALLTSSLLFAAIHVHLPSMLGLGLLGVILCLLYERTGSLWATMTMHAAFNATTITALILWPELAG